MSENENKSEKVSPVTSSFLLERVLKTDVAEDRMEAKLQIRTGFLYGHRLNEIDIYSYLQDVKIHPDRVLVKEISKAIKDLNEMLAGGKSEKIVFTIARGILPIKGMDGWKKFFHPIAKRVKILEDGTADYRNTDRYIHVKKNEKVGILFEGIPGKQGVDVFGNSVPPPPIRIAKIRIGKNVITQQETYPDSTGANDELAESKNQLISKDSDKQAVMGVKVFYAALDGVIYLTESSLSVSPELVFSRDVGLETGNVDYEGTVVVKGNVEIGSRLHCKGSLFVGGFIESDDLKVEEDLEVSGGIKTKGNNVIKVMGNLKAKYIENSLLEVDGDIILEGAIVNSTIYCMGNVILNGDSGNIVGSKIISYKNISVKNLGSSAGYDASVELGFHYKNDRSFHAMSDELKKMKIEHEKKIEVINKIKNIIQRSRGNLEDSKKAEFKEYFLKYTQDSQKLKFLEGKIEIAKQNRFNSEAVNFVARGGAFPGATIKYRTFVEKITVFESSFVINFFPGQDMPVKNAYKSYASK